MTKKLGKNKTLVIKAKKQVKNKPARNDKGQLLPGNTANPNGRPPKNYSFTEMLRQIMDEKPNLRRDFMQKMIDLALKTGDLTILFKFWAYLDGQPKQPIDLEPADTDEVDKLKNIVSDIANAIKKRRAHSGPKITKPI